MDDLMKKTTGLDFGVAKTQLFKTDDAKFKSGSISKSSQRSGALQEAIQLGPNPPHTPSDYLKAGKTVNIKEIYDSLNSDDVENMAILDFATLNFDRHGDNVLLQNVGNNPGQTRFAADRRRADAALQRRVPHDAASLLAPDAYNPNAPSSLNATKNMVTQSPQGNRPFSQRAKQAIAQLDPEAFTSSRKSEYENLVGEAPDVNGKVGDDSFDLMKKSITILKAAASQI